jgi:hypothetical protein
MAHYMDDYLSRSTSVSLSLSLSLCVCVCVCMQLCVTLLLCLQDGEEEGAPPHPAGPPPDTGHFIRENDLVVRLARSPTLVSLFLSFSLSPSLSSLSSVPSRG